MWRFDMVKPEEVGIAGKGIHEFLEAVKHAGIELHRLMILRNGKCCTKIVWDPYRAEDFHPVYSFSKSLTATAVGFARQEGLLRLDEKIADLFPEYLPEHPSENLLNCRIEHLLTMSCGHEEEIQDRSEHWIRNFFAQPFLHEPGTFYLYNTAGTNLLSAIIQQKTGERVTEYLKPRLFEPLGIEQVICARMPDAAGTEIGGAGMKMKLEDMAAFTQFMLQDGVWEGRELLPDWFSTRAGVKQIETLGDSANHVGEWANGYGYQCWMNGPEQSFRADGAYGQFGLVYPTYNMAIIMNSATEQTQTLMDAVNQHLLPAATKFIWERDYTPVPARLSLPTFGSCRNPLFEKELETVRYAVPAGKRMCGLAQLVGGAGLFGFDPDREINEISFWFSDHEIRILFMENGVRKTLHCARDRSFFQSEEDYVYNASAGWRSLRRLEAEIRRSDAISGVRLIFTFHENLLSIEADETLMTDSGLGMTDRVLCDLVRVEEA